MKYVVQYWAIFGGILAVFILAFLWSGLIPASYIQNLLWLHLISLLFHQFEEYVYPGGFLDFFNRHIKSEKGVIRNTLTDLGVVLINVIVAWSAFGISVFYGTNAAWLALGLALISISNGLLHTFMLVIKRKYNPGVYTGLVLFIPIGVLIISHLNAQLTLEDWLAGVGVFLFGSFSIPLIVYITSRI